MRGCEVHEAGLRRDGARWEHAAADRDADSSGNLDLPPMLPWLGKTQLQILSFVTSAILMVAHGFTSWAVTERVLLRDE